MVVLACNWITVFAFFTSLGSKSIKALPNVTHSGYVDVDKADGSQIFYTYYEAQEEVTKSTPVLLWLQVGLLISSGAHSMESGNCSCFWSI